MRKKNFVVLITLVLVFALSGCKSNSETSVYADTEKWVYLEDDKTASADVFFICPTVYSGTDDSFNMDMNDEKVKSDFLEQLTWKRAYMMRTAVFLRLITVRPV